MDAVTITSAILTLVAGIGIFLVACQMMSSNLESVSSKGLKNMFSKASGSKLLGVGIGTVGTAAIQSSGAITVMIIGFVNAGIMSLTQAATIIYGANIGTTVTAQIVALGMFGGNSISTTILFSTFAGIGAFIAMFAKKESVKRVGGILTGFGMLFVGLSMMSGSMSDFARIDAVKIFLAGIGNPLLLVLLGAIFTAIIQSSSVMTSVAIAMVVTGLINLDQGIFLTMGSNIGSCVVALIAGMTSGKNAKRTAMIHLIFNCSGVVIFMVIGWLVKLFTGGVTFGSIFESAFPGAPQTQLAMFHTVFNVATVILILPLTSNLVNLVTGLIPDDVVAADPDAPRFYHIDENMLKTPAVAARQTKKEVIGMGKLAMENFNRAMDMVVTLDFSDMQKFDKTEKELNFLNREIIDFIVRLSEKPSLSEYDMKYLNTAIRTVSDFERIGDYSENITEYAEHLARMNESFSDRAKEEIAELRRMVMELYDNTMEAYIYKDKHSLEKSYAIEDQIDDFTEKMENNHIQRLTEGQCSANVGSQYQALSSDTERIADHLINVGKSILRLGLISNFESQLA